MTDVAATPEVHHDKPSYKTKFFYGFGAIPYGVFDNGFSYFLLPFYSIVMGLPPQLTGLALMLALVFDAISDPLVGNLSDHWRSKWGRRHPFMYAAILPIAVSFFFLWSPPEGLSTVQLFWYLTLLAMVIRTCTTFYEIPSTSLVAEFTDDYDQRTTMLSFRYLFGWFGGLTMAILGWGVFLRPTETHPIGLTNVAGYLPYGLTASLIMAVAIFISAVGTHSQIPFLHKPPKVESFDLRKVLGKLIDTLSDRSFFALFMAAIASAGAGGIGVVMFIYLSVYYWGLTTGEIWYFPLFNIISAISAVIIASILARRRDKKRIAVGISIFSVFFLPLPIILRMLGLFWENGDPMLLPTLLVHNVIEVTALISIGILISSMVADMVESAEMRTGRRSEGLFFAARGFAAKCSSGIGLLIGGTILGIVDLPRYGASLDTTEPAKLTQLAMIYVPTIMIAYLLAIFALNFYKIDRAGHNDRVDTLRERRKK